MCVCVCVTNVHVCIGIFVLSNHSRSQFPAHAQHKLLTSSNGLAGHLLRDGANSHHKLLYASWPSSGLEEVLRQWPRIRTGAPAAELHVYGGFDWWWATPLYKDEAWFIEWRGARFTCFTRAKVHILTLKLEPSCNGDAAAARGREVLGGGRPRENGRGLCGNRLLCVSH